MQDGFGRSITCLRLSVTELCNLRCRYCMPEEGICKRSHEEMLTQEEMVLAAEAAASLGITKIRITGGEPLVKKNILSICRHIAAVSGIQELCLTTNGTLLPPMARALRDAGVQRLNISLDTLRPERYAALTRRGTLDQAWAGIQSALEAGFAKVKLNAVLIGGYNDDEIRDLAALTLRYPLDMRFIELMPTVGAAAFPKEAYLPAAAVLQDLPEAVPQPADGGVAELYRLPGAVGNIGLIRPVSVSFCGSCNRLRLTADGKLKPCLHSRSEYSLKGLDREGMIAEMRLAIQNKPRQHAPLSQAAPSQAGRSMNRIGG